MPNRACPAKVVLEVSTSEGRRGTYCIANILLNVSSEAQEFARAALRDAPRLPGVQRYRARGD
jgi:hypothetical protein